MIEEDVSTRARNIPERIGRNKSAANLASEVAIVLIRKPAKNVSQNRTDGAFLQVLGLH